MRYTAWCRRSTKKKKKASVIRFDDRSAWPLLLMWLATKEARGQVHWKEIEEECKKGGSDDALLELAAAVPLLDTPYRRTMARRQFDQELKRRGLPDTGGITTINIGTACAVEAAKKATESILNDSYLTDGEKQWCRRQIRILRGPRETFLSSSRASSQAKAAKVKKIYKMSKRKLQKHIRLQGPRLVQRRWDVGGEKGPEGHDTRDH